MTAPTAPTGRLRPIALGVIRRRDAILVFKGHDPSTGETFYRPLGGGIEFGEPVVEALRREIREELHVELGDVRYLGTLENLFVYDGRQGHEIVLVYEAMFADKSDYDRDLEGEDGDGGRFEVHWKDVNDFAVLGERLYPSGLLELIEVPAGSPQERARVSEGVTGPACTFCRIVTGHEPSVVIREDAATLSFLTVEPATEGHALVIPKRHARGLFDIGSADLGAIAVAAREVAQWQRERLGCAGVTLYQANEPAGFQTVFHMHVHVVPRYAGDRIVNAWKDVPFAARADLERVGRRLRGD